jgi:hypothetical protein
MPADGLVCVRPVVPNTPTTSESDSVITRGAAVMYREFAEYFPETA